MDELDSFYTVLNELTGKSVTLDELDYLAKRLDSFDDGEAAQFQGMAHKLGITQIKDFINLTFCCQRATVITDFSDLKEIGQEHYMNLNGGSASMEELENLDGVETALLLIDSGAGTVTPYGVVYDEELQQVNMAKTRLMAQKAELEKEQRGAAAFESRLAELDMALEQASGTLTDFDELTVRQLVSNIKVLGKDSLLICFKDGTEITQAMQRRQTA